MSAQVVRFRRMLWRSIVVEPAPRGLWRWQTYAINGEPGPYFCEPREHAEAVESAQQASRKLGLPAFYKGNTHAAPRPMRRRGMS